MKNNMENLKSNIKPRHIIVGLSVIIILLVQLFAAPRLKTYSAHTFTAFYSVYYMIVPTLGCFLCGVVCKMLLSDILAHSKSSAVNILLSVLAVLFGLAAAFVSVASVVEIVTGELPLMLMKTLQKIQLNHFLLVLFIRVFPFLFGLIPIKFIHSRQL